MTEQEQSGERAWGGYTVRLERSAEGWFYSLVPQQLGTGAVAGPAEQLPVGPFDTEDQAFEDAKGQALRLQRSRTASM